MPRAAKICSHPNCPNFQPCAEHQRKAWEGSDRHKTLPPGWDKLRLQILERDPICTECGNALSTEVHHRGDASDHRPEMLAGICATCHNPISARQGVEARRRSAGG